MANGMKEADDPKHCPYTARHGQDGTISWAILAQLPKRLRAFQLGCAYQDGGFPVVGFYDFGPLAAPVDSQKATRLWTLLEAKGRLLPTFSRLITQLSYQLTYEGWYMISGPYSPSRM